MAMIPEEFPVVLTVFLSMGAWRLAKKHSLVRHLPSVETLGAVSVLCVDKTGTITKNHMEVKTLWPEAARDSGLVFLMGLACETDAYDPMEKAMLEYCEKSGVTKENLFRGTLIQEYAFTNESRRMGHVWELDGERLVAAKGSPEAILELCSLSEDERKAVEEKVAPLRQKIAELSNPNPSAKDVIGGLGWIFGIAGAAALGYKKGKEKGEAEGNKKDNAA